MNIAVYNIICNSSGYQADKGSVGDPGYKGMIGTKGKQNHFIVALPKNRRQHNLYIKYSDDTLSFLCNVFFKTSFNFTIIQ